MDFCFLAILQWIVIGISTVFGCAMAYAAYLRVVAPFPGPKMNLLLGSAGRLIHHEGFMYKLTNELHEQYGDVVGYFLGPFEYHITVGHPEHIKTCFKKANIRPDAMKVFLPFLKGGDGFPLGTKHSHMINRRHQMGHPLHGKIPLANGFQHILKLVDDKLDRWTQAPHVNLVDEAEHLAREIVGAVLFGPWLNHPLAQKTLDLVHDVLMLVPVYQKYPFPQPWDKGYRDWMCMCNKIRPTCQAIIEVAQKDFDSDNIPPSDNDDPEGDIMSILLKSEHSGKKLHFDMEERIDILTFFIFGAVEDVFASYSWTLFALAKHPENVIKIRKELNEACPDPNAPMDYSMCGPSKMPFLEAFWKETMRFYLLGPVFPRTPMKSFKLTNDGPMKGKTVWKSATVWINQIQLDDKPEVCGPAPRTYCPERYFKDVEPSEEHPLFGAAPMAPYFGGNSSRACLGRFFATMSNKALALAVCKRATPTLLPEYVNTQAEAYGLVRQPLPSPLASFKQDMPKFKLNLAPMQKDW